MNSLEVIVVGIEGYIEVLVLASNILPHMHVSLISRTDSFYIDTKLRIAVACNAISAARKSVRIHIGSRHVHLGSCHRNHVLHFVISIDVSDIYT